MGEKVWVSIHVPISSTNVLKHPLYVWKECGMQYTLNRNVVALFAHSITQNFSQLFSTWETVWGGNGVCGHPYAKLLQQQKVLKHLIYVWHGCGIQFERFTASTILYWCCLLAYTYEDFSQLSLWGDVCWGNGVSGHPYALPQWKVPKHLAYVCHGCGKQSERFYSPSAIA